MAPLERLGVGAGAVVLEDVGVAELLADAVEAEDEVEVTAIARLVASREKDVALTSAEEREENAAWSSTLLTFAMMFACVATQTLV